MAHRPVPETLEQLAREWDHFIATTIYRVSRGQVRSSDVPDLKQSVYLRVLETGYLDRCRELLAERGGAFSTYLYMLVRSVCVNAFERNGRNPLNMALRIQERTRHPIREDRVFRKDVLMLESCRELIDAKLEREQEARDWLDRFEAHLRQRPAFGPKPVLVTLPNGRTEPRSLAAVFQLWRHYKVQGTGWPKQVAQALGVGESAVFGHMKRIRKEARQFAV